MRERDGGRDCQRNTHTQFAASNYDTVQNHNIASVKVYSTWERSQLLTEIKYNKNYSNKGGSEYYSSSMDHSSNLFVIAVITTG